MATKSNDTTKFYNLCDGVIQECSPGAVRWSMRDRRVARTFIPITPTRFVEVSTVFLCVDHSLELDPGHVPVLFETMVRIGQERWGRQERYHTFAEAVAGHARIVVEMTKEVAAEAEEDARQVAAIESRKRLLK